MRSDGPAGIALARAIRAPDLILLDIQLPGMDGYAVARALRQLAALEAGADRRRHLVRDGRGTARRCLAAGLHGYIEKPINPAPSSRRSRASVLPRRRREDDP